jgi:hypothetical protein
LQLRALLRKVLARPASLLVADHSERVDVASKQAASAPFIVTRCPDCGAAIVYDDPVLPGQAAVVQCVCKALWAAVAPRVFFVRAQDLHLDEEQRVQ